MSTCTMSGPLDRQWSAPNARRSQGCRQRPHRDGSGRRHAVDVRRARRQRCNISPFQTSGAGVRASAIRRSSMKSTTAYYNAPSAADRAVTRRPRRSLQPGPGSQRRSRTMPWPALTAASSRFLDAQFTGFQKLAFNQRNGGHYEFDAPSPGLHPSSRRRAGQQLPGRPYRQYPRSGRAEHRFWPARPPLLHDRRCQRPTAHCRYLHGQTAGMALTATAMRA